MSEDSELDKAAKAALQDPLNPIGYGFEEIFKAGALALLAYAEEFLYDDEWFRELKKWCGKE